MRVQPIPDSTDEDETDSKPVEKKETPIEREIRLARERENELRVQKGLPLLSEPVKPAEDDSQSKSSGGEDSVSYSYRSKVNTAEGNKSMRNFASSRLQNEILNYAQFDGWELRQLINFVAADDGVPEPEIIIEVLKGCRNNNDYALATRFLEVVRLKGGNKMSETWPYIMQEIGPTMQELGISTLKEMGYEEPELWLENVDDM